MKTFKIILAIAAIAMSTSVSAQKTIQEDTLIVKGICNMCKERIEQAAYGNGVKFASWDLATDQLSVAYRSDKTSLEEIEQRILKAGHSTENAEADKGDYEKLPECCRYEHMDKH